MSDATLIEWTDATWNPVTGCTLVDRGCDNCYAARLAATRLQHNPSRAGLTRLNAAGVAKWTGEVRFNEQWLDQPLRWTNPRRIFVCAHSDLFHDSVPDDWIDRIFAVMALAPQHTFQVLTKRPDRAARYLTGLLTDQDRLSTFAVAMMDIQAATDCPSIRDSCARHGIPWRQPRSADDWLPLPNVWLGTSISDQASADARIPELLACPAAVRFVSAEPLLGPVDLTCLTEPEDKSFYLDALSGDAWDDENGGLNHEIWGSDIGPRLDWVICGGESGLGARPMHPDWPRSLRDQCLAAGVPFFFKQWGEWGRDTGILPDLRDPVMEGRAKCAVVQIDGSTQHYPNGYGPPLDGPKTEAWLYRLGKKNAGRLLDDRTWDQMPEGLRHG
jgi:protein gp37